MFTRIRTSMFAIAAVAALGAAVQAAVTAHDFGCKQGIVKALCPASPAPAAPAPSKADIPA